MTAKGGGGRGLCGLSTHFLGPCFRRPEVVAAYLAMLGFRCTWRGRGRLPPGRHVMVSNHVTAGDLMVLFQVGVVEDRLIG